MCRYECSSFIDLSTLYAHVYRLLTVFFCYILFFLYLNLLQALLVSGGSDGLLVVWSADHSQDSRELVPKLSLKAIISLSFHIFPNFSLTTIRLDY